MRRTIIHRSLSLTWALVLLLAACAEEPAEPFSSLEPDYFAALDVTDAATRQKLPDFERRMSRTARALITQNEQGELRDPEARREAGRALFYAGFLPHVGHHGLEDGLGEPAALLHPPQYTDGSSDQAELRARMQESARLLQAAAALRPDDSRIPTVQRSVRFNLAVLDGPLPTSLLSEMASAASADLFGTFAALVLWRDPALHPLSSPHMTSLFQLVCSPARFDCARTGPPPVDPMAPPPTLTQLVVGPAMLSDLLVKRVEQLADQAADQAPTQPAAAKATLKEAKDLLAGAHGTLAYATLRAGQPALRHFRYVQELDERMVRADELGAAIDARLADRQQPLPERASFYRGRAYRALYQCVACHTAGPDQTGVPK